MSEQKDLDLLLDIARLLKKYGPETFESLAKELSSPEFAERLVNVLSTFAKTSREIKQRNIPKKTTRDFRLSLIEIQKKDSEKGDLLLQFYDGLIAKKYLPTIKDIRFFILASALPSINATSREKVINALITALLPLSTEEVKSRLSQVKPVLPDNERGLEGWSNVILDKDRNKKQ